jgi:hypothetical protein
VNKFRLQGTFPKIVRYVLKLSVNHACFFPSLAFESLGNFFVESYVSAYGSVPFAGVNQRFVLMTKATQGFAGILPSRSQTGSISSLSAAKLLIFNVLSIEKNKFFLPPKGI